MKDERLTETEPGRLFDRLVEENKDLVYNLCYRILRNTEDAEDASQEVFISVYKSIDNFRGEADIRTWLYRIALNKALDIRKSKSAKKRAGIFLSIFGDNKPVMRLKAAYTSSPSRRVEDKERKEVLEEALNSIPEKQRTAILLSKIEGMPQKEIADIMRLSEGAVESLLSRAKKNLQDLLRDYYVSTLGETEG